MLTSQNSEVVDGDVDLGASKSLPVSTITAILVTQWSQLLITIFSYYIVFIVIILIYYYINTQWSDDKDLNIQQTPLVMKFPKDSF